MTTIRLEDGGAHAEVVPLGAELRGWSVDGAPLLWSPDPAVWPDTAPILFPVVGWTRGAGITVEGRRYPLGLHGFARAMPFAIVERAQARVRLRLTASARTRALYPFAWTLDVEHALAGVALVTRVRVRNDGDRVMPYAVGLHPGFRWPFAGGDLADYSVHFAEPEAARVPVISPEGLFTRRTRPVPLRDRRLPLSEALMREEALCFLHARSSRLRFAHRSGAAIDVALEDFPHLALWSRPAGRFLCVEAWTGHGDFIDADGDLAAKPSMRHLPPGASADHAATFTFVPATFAPASAEGGPVPLGSPLGSPFGNPLGSGERS